MADAKPRRAKRTSPTSFHVFLTNMEGFSGTWNKKCSVSSFENVDDQQEKDETGGFIVGSA
jgi:hypothetical protein